MSRGRKIQEVVGKVQDSTPNIIEEMRFYRLPTSSLAFLPQYIHQKVTTGRNMQVQSERNEPRPTANAKERRHQLIQSSQEFGNQAFNPDAQGPRQLEARRNFDELIER